MLATLLLIIRKKYQRLLNEQFPYSFIEEILRIRVLHVRRKEDKRESLLELPITFFAKETLRRHMSIAHSDTCDQEEIARNLLRISLGSASLQSQLHVAQ